MNLTSDHKALLITAVLAFLVWLSAAHFYITKKPEQIAETYYELLPEDYEEETLPESLEEILKSFDELTTNKAFNSTRNYDDYEDQDFKETMDKLNSRHTKASDPSASESSQTMESTTASTPIASQQKDHSKFNEINDLIAQTKGSNTANKNSTVSYSLVGRDKLSIAAPIYLCEASGKIVISIVVDAQGSVTEASFNTASTSDNGCLVEHALEYARQALFSTAPSKPQQVGTITFLFRGK